MTTPLRKIGDWLQIINSKHFTISTSFKEIKNYRAIAASGLFDRNFYLNNYPDVQSSGLDPLIHFLKFGAKEGRRPNSIFDTDWYMRTYPDVTNSNINPLLHYLLHGVKEGRDPGPNFDTLDYLDRHPDLHGNNINPLAHYLANHDLTKYPNSCTEAPTRKGSHLSAQRSIASSVKQNKNQSKTPFNDFSSYENNSIFLLKLDAPFSEEAKRVFGYMHGMRRHLAQRHAKLPENDLVSIIMPTFNRASCIGTAVRSVLDQSYQNFELIIVDDGGDDATSEVISKFNVSRILYSRLDKNQGAAVARNRGLELAQGDFITYLDSDNTMEPDFLLILAGELRSTPAADIVYCGQNIYVIQPGSKSFDLEAVRYASFSRAVLENRNYIDLGVLLHRRKIVENNCRFNDKMQRLIDWEFLLKITEKSAPMGVPCLLSNYYHGAADNQITKSKSYNKALVYIDNYLAEDRISEELPDHGISGLDEMYSPRFIPISEYARKVAIIIPNYECLNYLKLCISSIQHFTQSDYEIIVVDNASSGPVREYLREINHKPDCTVIQNDHNLGFTYAVNQGIHRADPDCDVVLLNNDAVVSRGWITAMQHVFDSFPDAGLVVPRQVLLANTPTIGTHNPIYYSTREADVNISIHHDNIVDPNLSFREGYFELSFAPFFCVYIPRHTLFTLGSLDHENGPHYRSDRLYCEAVRRIANRKIIYTPHSKVYHFLQQSTTKLKHDDADVFNKMFVKNEWTEIKYRV